MGQPYILNIVQVHSYISGRSLIEARDAYPGVDVNDIARTPLFLKAADRVWVHLNDRPDPVRSSEGEHGTRHHAQICTLERGRLSPLNP